MNVPEPEKHQKIMIVAGEASGDLHGANLVREMKRLDPSLSFCGIGGARLEAEGVRLLARSSEMAVVGITEVLSKLRFIVEVFFRLRKIIFKEKPRLIILIDYPDFNLRLAATAKRFGVKVFYYISPQVWAWRKGRVRQIRRIVDRMAVILPFEEAFYAQAGYDVTFVGHPLLDVVKCSATRPEIMARLKLRDKHPVIALLPGSREKEVKGLLPTMLEAAALLVRDFADAQFVLPLAETIDPLMVDRIRQNYTVPVTVVTNRIYDTIAIADAAMVTSGTATLETALLEVPMVIVYKISPFTAAIGRRIIHLEHIGLVNIIAGQTIVPELIQEDVTASRLAGEIRTILLDKSKFNAMRRELADLRAKLGKKGASQRTAELAVALLNES